MDKFIQKLDFDFLTNQRILQLIAQIDQFKGEWNLTEKQQNRYLNELQRMATVQSIGSSTRIEGATLTDQEVETLLKEIKITKLQSRDEQEVVGYYEVLELIYEHFGEISLTENYIKQLHQRLLWHSHKDERHRGEYKHLSNQVVATYPSGEQRVVFETTAPAMVAVEMQTLVEWTQQQLAHNTIHPLIVIANFIYEFLSIHPFQDGNGRLSRLLTTLCLLQNDYLFIQYVSFEHHIEQHKTTYYKTLRAGQQHRGTDAERIDHWLLFFLESLHALTEKLTHKYQQFKSKGAYLNERQELIKSYVSNSQPIKISDLRRQFPDIPLGTLKKDVQYLCQEQVLRMLGRGRGTVYVLCEE